MADAVKVIDGVIARGLVRLEQAKYVSAIWKRLIITIDNSEE
ncbi:hypothetical protein [Citrobacter portucalensis]|nr:hypothetical protein [Citrobacter portucalensis]